MNEIKIQLPKPHQYQQQVINDKTRFKVLLCGRRWGKTLCALIISIQKMLSGERVAYVTPSFDLAKNFYNELIKILPTQLIKSDNKTDLSIELITGGSIKFFSGEALERFRGYKFHYVIVDEAAFISDLKESWYSAIRPTLSDYEGGGLFISTPKGKEFFYSLYIKGCDPLETEFKSFHFPSNTNPYFPVVEFESARKSLPSFQFNQEYLAIAGENSNNPFGTDNINKNMVTSLSNEETIVYGIDLAKYNDYTVIIGLSKTGKMTYFNRFQTTWQQTQQKIQQLPSNILKVVDSTGVGDVVFENLSYTCSNIQGFKFTTESKPKIIYELIKDVENGVVNYNEITANEMHTFEYKYSSTGHIKFESQTGFHDDAICALAIANHYRYNAIQSSNWSLKFC